MKKSDNLTFIGLILGVVLLILGMAIGGNSLLIFLNIPALFITVGGSIAALLVNYSATEIKDIGKLFGQSLKENKFSGIDLIIQFTHFSKKARREGLLSLENDIAILEDDFMKKGLQMVVDGFEADAIKEILELEIDEMENRQEKGATIFKAWGSYAPAFGMIGTLIGLIQMLAGLNELSAIAAGMAKALVSTFYGAIIAYLFCNPISQNLLVKSSKEAAFRGMILEGILSIQEGVNPRIIEEKLSTYLSPKDRLEYLRWSSSIEGEILNG